MFSPGDTFGRYSVEKMLGKGGMGAVYLVRHTVLDTEFALKILFPEVAEKKKEFVVRFIREAKLACRIRHPNLIGVHDAGQDEKTGMYYLVMDYVSGGSLRERLRAQGRLPVPETVEIVRQVASALVAARKHGMVHRDIKPENIMFSGDGSVKLADLGIAKSSGDQDTLVTVAAAVFGTPSYMSPEQARDSGKVDCRADLWSLGVVFFELLCGQRPIQGKALVEIVTSLLSNDPMPDVRTINPAVPEKVAVLVAALLQKDVQKRMATPEDLVAALSAVETAGAVERESRVGGLPPGSPGVTEVTMATVSPSPVPLSAEMTMATVASPSGVAPTETTMATVAAPVASTPGEETVATVAASPWTVGGGTKTSSRRPKIAIWTAVGVVLVLAVAAGLAVFLLRSRSGESSGPKPVVVKPVSPSNVTTESVRTNTVPVVTNAAPIEKKIAPPAPPPPPPPAVVAPVVTNAAPVEKKIVPPAPPPPPPPVVVAPVVTNAAPVETKLGSSTAVVSEDKLVEGAIVVFALESDGQDIVARLRRDLGEDESIVLVKPGSQSKMDAQMGHIIATKPKRVYLALVGYAVDRDLSDNRFRRLVENLSDKLWDAGIDRVLAFTEKMPSRKKTVYVDIMDEIAKQRSLDLLK